MYEARITSSIFRGNKNKKERVLHRWDCVRVLIMGSLTNVFECKNDFQLVFRCPILIFVVHIWRIAIEFSHTCLLV